MMGRFDSTNRWLGRRRKIIIAVALAILMADAALALFRDRVALFIVNGRAGCWPWSSGVVEYHDGMTLCPGQSVELQIIFVVPRRSGDGSI